jgi:hypothetical protein
MMFVDQAVNSLSARLAKLLAYLKHTSITTELPAAHVAAAGPGSTSIS